jgi:butyrate kinase
MFNMKDYLQLIINPGSTSTKIAVFKNKEELFTETIRHSAEVISKYKKIADQLEFRKNMILDFLKEKNIDVKDLSAIVGRGGLLKPLEGGTYEISGTMCEELKAAKNGEHASNLAAIISKDISDSNGGIPCFISDPVVVDEMIPEARPTGILSIQRKSILHALNQKAIARKAAAMDGKKYSDCNYIVAHLGGGISVGAHRKGRIIDTNNALDGDGPITPERAGTIPAGDLAKLCFSGEYTLDEVKKMLTGKGGCVALLGTNDGREMEKNIEDGDEKTIKIIKAMAYTIAKSIGERAVALKGEIDAILLTGSMAYMKPLVDWIKEWISFLAPVKVFAGENEMISLAEAGLRVLQGEEDAKEYK